MNRLRELVVILCIVVLVAAACSHLAIRLLKIKTSWGGYQPYGVSGQKVSTFLYGSSLAYSGIDWHKVSEALGEPIVSWASTGSTPSEWEQMHRHSANASRSFIVFAAADLNEYSLCDFRAEIVPLSRTVVDLWQMKADWPYIKMVLSQYPVTAVRMFFPTVGRSDGVMTGIRDELKKIIATGNRTESGEAFRVGLDGNMAQEERVSNWPPGRFQRRMVLLRAACQGKHDFNGLKKAALMRLIQKASQQGEVIWSVVPVSPFYQKEFMTTAVRQNFEMALADLQRSAPHARLIRLDQLPLLRDNNMFSDFVHLNRSGQKIATAEFLEKLGNDLKRP